MTPDELIALGQARHGERWIGPLSEEIGYSFTAVWRAAKGSKPLPRRMELEIERIKQPHDGKVAPMTKKRPPITLAEVPLILSSWRRLEHSQIPSDRQLFGALRACVNRLVELGEFGPVQEKVEKPWGERVGK